MKDNPNLALFDAISPVVWRLPRMLAYACQPGYPHERVPEALVTAWLNHVRTEGIASIICLLSGRELATSYGDHRVGLLRRYREGGFQVAHISVPDQRMPPVPESVFPEIRHKLCKLPVPWLFHCSSGLDRSAYAASELADWPCIRAKHQRVLGGGK